MRSARYISPTSPLCLLYISHLVATEPALQDEECALEAVVRVEGLVQLLDVGRRGRRIA